MSGDIYIYIYIHIHTHTRIPPKGQKLRCRAQPRASLAFGRFAGSTTSKDLGFGISGFRVAGLGFRVLGIMYGFWMAFALRRSYGLGLAFTFEVP